MYPTLHECLDNFTDKTLIKVNIINAVFILCNFELWWMSFIVCFNKIFNCELQQQKYMKGTEELSLEMVWKIVSRILTLFDKVNSFRLHSI